MPQNHVMNRFRAAITMLLCAGFVQTANAGNTPVDGDAKKGQKIYKKCATCHFADREKHLVGPHLVKIIGRKAGTAKNYAYSKAMRKKGNDGLIWTEDNLVTYLRKPKAFVPGTNMNFAGIRKETDRINLVTYLKQLSTAAQ